jgi:hypothetical protein
MNKVLLLLFFVLILSCAVLSKEVDIESTVDRVFAMKENAKTDDSGVETEGMEKVVLEKVSEKENTLETILEQEAKAEEEKQQAHAKIESEGDEILENSSTTVLSEPSDETKESSTTLSSTPTQKPVENQPLDFSACFDLCVNTGNDKTYCSKSCKA